MEKQPRQLPTQESFGISPNQKVHYIDNKIPLLVPILSQINLFYMLANSMFKINFKPKMT